MNEIAVKEKDLTDIPEEGKQSGEKNDKRVDASPGAETKKDSLPAKPINKESGMVTKEIEIDQLKFDPEVLARSSVVLADVEQYAEDLENGANFPPIDVMDDGDDNYLCDGNIRVNAHMKLGKTTIMANVHKGTRRDGILLSCKANTKHGKRRSGGEAKEMILRLLKDEEWQQWGAGVIAEKCGSSRQWVNKVKSEFSTGTGFQFPTTTIGKDKKIRNTENIGKNQGPSEEELKKAAQEKAELEKQEELKKAEELKKQEELEKKEIELKKQKEEQDKKEAELKKEADELKRQKEEQEKQKKLEQEKMKKLKQEKAAKEKEELKKAEELKKQAAQEKAELEKAEQEKAALKKAELEKAAQEKAALEKAELEKVAQEKEDLKKQVELGAASITSNVKAEADITVLKQQIQDLEGIVIDKDKRIFSLEKQTDDYQSLIAELEIKIDELESEKEGLKMVNQNLQQEIDQLEPETV